MTSTPPPSSPAPSADPSTKEARPYEPLEKEDDTDMRVPDSPEADASFDEYEDSDFDDPMLPKLLDIAEAGAEADRHFQRLKTSLSDRSKALERAVALRSQARRPRNTATLTAALTAAKNKVSSSQEGEAVRRQLERMQMRYAEPEDTNTERDIQQAEEEAEEERAAAKQALFAFEAAKAKVAKLELELARMQQPEETTVDDSASEDGREEWRGIAEKMASVLDRTFLKTGGYDPKKPPVLKRKGAWFCGELKLWYVAPGKDAERAECLKTWPEHALSFRELQTLLCKMFNWSDQ